MLGFGNKNQQAPQGSMGTPTQKVLSLSSQGMSDPEIINALRREGYAPMEVDRAMKDAMRNNAAPGMQSGRISTPPYAPQGPNPAQRAPQAPYPQGGPYPQRPAAAPAPAPGPGQPFGDFDEKSFSKNKFAPTDWGDDEEMPDDDLDMQDVPKDRRLGPSAMFSELDEDKFPLSPGMQQEKPDREPLRFSEPPLPKGGDERDREVKDRRRREVEEMVEQIAEEKWQDMARRVHDAEDRIERLASDMKNAPARAAGGPAPEEVSSLKSDVASVRQAVEETNARIDSLEEVVKGSLTPMIESIRKLRSAATGPSAMPPSQSRPTAPAARPQPRDESYEIPRYAPPKDEDE